MRRVLDRAVRFWWSCDAWERGLWLSSWLLTFALVAGVALKLILPAGHDAPTSDVLETAAHAPVVDAEGLLPARPPAAAEPAPTEQPSPTAEEPRPAGRDCHDIGGIDFRNPAARQWYLENCVPLTSAASVAGAPVPPPPELAGDIPQAAPPPPQPSPPPADTPADAGADPRAEAIALAVQWLRTEGPAVYDADASACTATLLNHWVVTCVARLQGCPGGADCVQTVSVCVDLQPPSVRPTEDC